MSLFYTLSYMVNFAPWENAARHGPAATHIAALLDREEAERTPPYGRALDLGCGRGHWSIELAKRGWQTTGIDLVGSAIEAARKHAAEAGVRVRFVQGDATAMRAAGIEPEFQFVWDFGALHGLSDSQRRAVARELDALAASGATMLILAWAPGRRWPLPRGASRADLENVFSSWRVIDEAPFDASGLPPPLRTGRPCFYRLRKA
ncbi:MAG TPA: class I SAM-dependent methyltransferase [Hyphomicrobiaceae bacterium]|nr:class I SAM-dependent methyltransferase [Hyphomicrobiaceae bacterium]